MNVLLISGTVTDALAPGIVRAWVALDAFVRSLKVPLPQNQIHQKHTFA